jgi:cytochrome c556
VQDGGKLEDDHVEGNAKLEDIVANLARDQASFAAAARTLQTAALAVLAAIDARDLQRIGETGSALDAACESCHLNYWYPNQKLPHWTAPKSSVAAK